MGKKQDEHGNIVHQSLLKYISLATGLRKEGFSNASL